MITTAIAGAEAGAFRDVPADKLITLALIGSRALLELEVTDKSLQASEEPQPVMSISVSHERDHLPHIWLGVGMTEPGKGLQYVEDADYHPKPNAPSIKVPVHGLAVPVDGGSVSSMNFWPFALSGHEEQVPNGWWEHWQQHRFTLQGGDYRHVRDYEDEISFPPFATWFRQNTLEKESGVGVRLAEPVVVTSEAEAAEFGLAPYNIHGRYVDLRNRAAIYVGKGAIQVMLSDTSRLGVARDAATEPFHAMMAAAANELGLDYQA